MTIAVKAQDDIIQAPSAYDIYENRPEEEMQTFRKDLLSLLKSGSKKTDIPVFEWDLIKYLYSSVPTYELDSGADLWARVIKLGKKYYYPPTDEARLIDDSRDYLKGLFKTQPTVIDLVPGGYDSLEGKTLPTLKAVNPKNYIAFDHNSTFAYNAADFVKKNFHLGNSSFVHGDFTKPHDLKTTAPVLMTMYGCTLSQFPLSKTVGSALGSTPLKSVLKNLGEMVDYDAVFIATIDSNDGEGATECYIGPYMAKFMINLWDTVKTLLELNPNDKNNFVCVEGNKRSRPSEAFKYDPYFNGRGVVHSFFAKKEMDFVINGEQYSIPRGAQIDIGFSERWPVDAVVQETRGTGWSLAKVLPCAQSSISALVFAGKNVSEEQLLRAKGEVLKKTNSPPTEWQTPYDEEKRLEVKSPFTVVHKKRALSC